MVIPWQLCRNIGPLTFHSQEMCRNTIEKTISILIKPSYDDLGLIERVRIGDSVR